MHSPPSGGFGRPSEGGAGQPLGYQPALDLGPPPNPTFPLVLNVVGCFLCCGPACFVFLPGCVQAVRAKRLLRAGDVAGARAKVKLATTLGFAGYGAGAVFSVAYTLVCLAIR